MNNLEFTLEMKNKRLASGLSQGELASLTHVSRYSINRFENGKANASKETQNVILRCLNYYVCDKPFYLLVDYLSVRFPTTDELEVIRKVLGMKADYFIHYDYGYYGYKEHYAYAPTPSTGARSTCLPSSTSPTAVRSRATDWPTYSSAR